MARNGTKVVRINERLNNFLMDFSKKNKIKYIEASKLAADLLIGNKFSNKKVIESIRREIEF